MIISVMLCSCALGKMHESKRMNFFDRIECSLEKEYSDTAIHIADSNSSKCIYYESKFESENAQQRFIIENYYEYDYTTGKISKLDFLTEEERNKNTFICLPNEELLSLDSDYNISLLNSGHNVVATNNLRELNLPDQEQKHFSIDSVFDIKSDGEYIFITGTDNDEHPLIFVLDHNLNEKAAIYTDSKLFLISANGNKIRFVDEKKSRIYEYVATENKIKDVGKTPQEMLESNLCIGDVQGNDQYDYYFFTKGKYNKNTGRPEDTLVGVKGEKAEIIMDFSVMGIDGLFIEKIVSDGQEGFWVWGTIPDGKMMLYHFVATNNAKDYSAKSNKICCKIGRLSPPNDSLQFVLDQFSKDSNDYYFETVVYQELYAERDIAIMHLFLDCQNGKIDGVILDGIEEDFIKNNVLVDLQDYILQSKVVAKDQFITHYWESVTDSNGKIYALYPSFRAIGYAYEEPIDFSNLPKYEALCAEKQPFLSTMDTDSDLYSFLKYSGNKFIEDTTGELHINEDEFKSVLQFVKDQSECRPRNVDPVTQYCEGESLATYVQLVEPTDYLYFNRLFHENVTFSNVGTDGLVIGDREGLLGICANTTKKEVFYDFYDYLFTPSVYHDFYFSGWIIPVLKEEYGFWKDYFLATEEYIDKYGKINKKYAFQIGLDTTECIIDVGSITEKEANDAVKILQEAKYIKPMKEAYINIILEEASAYFSGGRDLDEVCKIMENRLRIAMNEIKQ